MSDNPQPDSNSEAEEGNPEGSLLAHFECIRESSGLSPENRTERSRYTFSTEFLALRGLSKEVERALHFLSNNSSPRILGITGFQEASLEQPLTITCADCAGAPVSALAGKGVQYPIPEVLHLLVETLQALLPLHQEGLCHGELSAERILVNPDRSVLLRESLIPALARRHAFDPALADSAATRALTSQMLSDSPVPLAPEQLTEATLSPKVDLYALGVIVYELLTGRPPFSETDPRKLYEQKLAIDPPAPHTIRADLPLPLAVLICELLARDPKHRPADATAVLRALLALPELPPIEGFSLATLQELLAQHPGSALSRLGIAPSVAIGITATLFVTALAIVALLWDSSSTPPEEAVPVLEELRGAGVMTTEQDGGVSSRHLSTEYIPYLEGNLLVWQRSTSGGVLLSRLELPAALNPIERDLPLVSGEIALSSNGDTIAYIAADTTQLSLRSLTSDALQVIELGTLQNPAVADWSNDDSQLLLLADTLPKEGDVTPTRNVFAFSIPTGTISQLTTETARLSSPSLNFSGTKLLFATDQIWPGSDVCIRDLPAALTRCILYGEDDWVAPRWVATGASDLFTVAKRSLQTTTIYSGSVLRPGGIAAITSLPAERVKVIDTGGTGLLYTTGVENQSTIFLHDLSGEDRSFLRTEDRLLGFSYRPPPNPTAAPAQAAESGPQE